MFSCQDDERLPPLPLLRHNPPAIGRTASLIPLVLAAWAGALSLTPAALAHPDSGESQTGAAQIAPPPHFRVVVVEDFTAADLESFAKRAAVGLLVPGVGSVTNRHAALESLVRGADVNPYLTRAPGQGPVLHTQYVETLPPSWTHVIAVALPPGGPLRSNETRYPIAVIGGGYHGLLTSPTTRIRGLVSIVDVAPTALGHVRGALGFAPVADPLPQLRLLDGQIHANDRLKMATLIIIACCLVLLAVVRPRAALPAVLAALGVNLVAGAAHVASEPLLVAMMLLGTIAGGLLVAQLCTGERRLLAAILAVLFVYLVLFVLHPEWVAITPLGPTQNSRFWGIGNQLETLLLAPIVAGASIASRRYGLAGFGAFALLALVLVTDNRLGSDGGGAIVFGVALAYVGARVLRLGWRGFLTLLLLDGAVVTAIIELNLRLPGPDHLRSAFAHGIPGLLSVAADRLPLAYLPALHQWPLLVPLGLMLAAAFAVAVRACERSSRDLVFAASLALAISLLVNDSGTYELAGGVAVIAALARFTTAVATVPDVGV